MPRAKTVYQRIVRASKHDRGLRLTAADVATLASDNAIEQRAELDDLIEQDPEFDETVG